jgi:UPF0755 protein
LLRTIFKLLVIAVLVVAIWLARGLWLPARPSQTTYVQLRPGWSTRHIAAELQSAGVIRSARAFLLYHYIGHPKTLKAGEYKFEESANPIQIHQRLVSGDIFQHIVTIPEGYNMFDVASSIEAAGLGSREDFLKAATQQVALIHDLDPDAKSLDGYLFPDTYGFTRTQTMTDMVTAMVKRFREEAHAIGLKTDVHRTVTLASIVEKETGVAEERPLVASVYVNRLGHGIALDADPSVIYAALLDGKYDGKIYQSELHAESPYNTYKFPGLPPGPIANPGRASLQAAMQPAKSDYYYFVSDNNGHHRFARTLEEHTQNVVAYRRAVAASR